MAVDLSVAIIFKNDARCIERCLKSLQPLKEAVSCEIVMADTGSTDGSREIAERYADVVFDFEWVNDFSAARNAVLARCSGRWVFAIDSDEWLDSDIQAFTDFLRNPRSERYIEGAMVLYNYITKEFDRYAQGCLGRVFRMSAKPRYVGAIHEAVIYDAPDDRCVTRLVQTVLHHDGYVMLNDGSEAGRAKLARNMALLRKEIERKPEDLRTLMQLLECGENESDLYEKARYAVRLVEEKKPGYESFGPGILRTAVDYAIARKWQEAEEWAATAERLFPDAPSTRIDIELAMEVRAWKSGEWDECIRRGEAYLRAYRRFRSDKENAKYMRYVAVTSADDFLERRTCFQLAVAYRKQGDGKRAYEKLRELPADALDVEQTAGVLKTAAELFEEFGVGTELLIRDLWSAVCGDEANGKTKERKRAFLDMGRKLFADVRTGDRAGWEIFLPLAGDCPLGDAVLLLRCESPEEADGMLARVEDPAELPGTALVHAMRLGAAFPVPGKPLTVEQADALAVRLMEDRPFLREAAVFAASAMEDDADVIWARALVLAAVRDMDWKADNEAAGALLYAFVRIGSAFLARCYSGRALRSPEYLPPLYRFALHLANAFSILDAAALFPEFTPTVSGGVRDALAELKAAAFAAPEHKAAVDWVLDGILRTDS